MAFAKGWNTDAAPKSPPHRLGLGTPDHLASVTVPTSADVPAPPPVDQGQSSSCTANSSGVVMQECMTRTAWLTRPTGTAEATTEAFQAAIRAGSAQWVELPSRRFLYFHARAAIGEIAKDNGGVIADIFDEASLVGVPPESVWPFSDELAAIVEEPSWKAYRAAADQKVKIGIEGAYRIMSTGANRVDDVKRALGQGCLVVWGTELDRAFEDLPPDGVWNGVTGPSIGGHAMFIHKLENVISAPSLDDVLWSRSSWGGNFGIGGSRRITARAIASSDADDFWIVKAMAPYSAESLPVAA